MLPQVSSPPFTTDIFLGEIRCRTAIAEYPANSRIFGQGDPANHIFRIREGKVKLTVVSNQGKEAVVAILGAGDFFGEGCLAGQPYRVSTATAMSFCSTLKAEKELVAQLLRDNSRFSELFVAHLLSRQSRIEEDLVDQLLHFSEKRLARTLLLLANFGKGGEPQRVICNINQETLAEIVGTTRSRVSYFMNRFRQLRFIDYSRGAVRVHSSLLKVVLPD